MALKQLAIHRNKLVDLARELKIRFPALQLKIFKGQKKITVRSKTKLNYFELKEIELLVSGYFPNYQIQVL
jgi:hypothetical protein